MEMMEKAKGALELSEEEINNVSKLVVKPHRAHVDYGFYNEFSTQGIKVDRVEPNPGLIVCSFKVPPRLIDREGNLAAGAIANLVDNIGYALIYRPGRLLAVTINMSISYFSNAKLDDELEITSRIIGKFGAIEGMSVVILNKASGKVVAEARNIMFSKL